MSRDDEVRRQALVRDIGRRLAISSIAEVEAIDQRLVELERARDAEANGIDVRVRSWANYERPVAIGVVEPFENTVDLGGEG